MAGIGILDLFSDPANQGVLNLASGLLQASGPSRIPVSFGQALGHGLQQGTQAYQGAQHNQMKQRFMQAQLDAMNRPALPENPFGKINPKDFTRDSIAVFQRTMNPADLVAAPPQEDEFTRTLTGAGIKPGSPEWIKAHQERAARMTAPQQPLVTLDNRQANEFEQIVGRQFGEQYAGLMRADMNAPSTMAKYQRLGSLLSQVNTGKFKGATTDLKAAAKSLGIDLTALGVPDDVAPAQAARALSNQIALELRNPQGGAGMPGALSERDLKFLLDSTPGLENDPASIPIMIEYRVRLAKREQEVAKKARAYRKKHGKYDDGFYEELAEWSEKNPLFPETPPTPKPSSAAPAGGFRVLGVEGK